ncbi:MAG: fructose-1,6-bisphosphatase, partial [Phycisphaerales bacterium]|nr:fructose-1,6-bisphosphatase [Phycisphaerales bacterium]
MKPDPSSPGGRTEFTPERLRYLQALSASYPDRFDALREAAGLSATLTLDAPTIHVISDIHGEDLKLRHVIHNASGALRPLVEKALGDVPAQERERFLAILYYPREALHRLMPQVVAGGPEARTRWVYDTLTRQCEIIRALRRNYRRNHVTRLVTAEFRELLVEMLSAARPDYCRAMIAAFARNGHDRDFGAVRAASRLIRSLAAAELIVAGDMGDRGPRIDRVTDILMAQPNCSVLWGNHDAIWMGAALGHDACILTVLRFSARYRRAAQLEEGYGILTTPLEKLVRDKYADDPAEHFKAKGEGVRDALTVARMQKAIAIMQFKAEGQLFARRPEWNLEHRRLLHRIDFNAGTVTIDGKSWPLTDTRLPTVDPTDPYAYSPEEAQCMEALRQTFISSQKLRNQMQWLVRKGGVWTRRDDVLIFHACVPVDEKGEPLAMNVDGREVAGRELMDELQSVTRRAFRNGPISATNPNPDADWLYYLWGGPRSPLFGKDKLATFESHFIADKAAHKEQKNPYFELMHDAAFVRRIGRMFGIDGEGDAGVLLVNGHVPVKVEKGEHPVKRGGNAVTIDGAFSAAYGDRGYTLVIRPDRVDLAEHAPFQGVDAAIDSGADIVPTVQTIKRYS